MFALDAELRKRSKGATGVCDLMQAMYEKQQRRRAEIENFVRRFRAKASKATQAQSRLKELDRMQDIAPAHIDSPFSFRFADLDQLPDFLMQVEQLSIGFAEPLVERINLSIRADTRIGLLGFNGSGKSTLLRVLSEQHSPLAGEITRAKKLKVGYYAQHQVDELNQQSTPFELIQQLDPKASAQEIRNYLGGFDFRGERINEQISVFSGGEKARLALARVVRSQPNLLLMDEPTTHLDMASIDALIAALKQYEGTLVFISHDVHFIRAISAHTIHVNAGKLRNFPGGYDYYLQKTQAETARAGLTLGSNGAPVKAAPAKVKVDRRAQKRAEAEARQARSRERRGVEKEVKRLEAEIQTAEQKITELTAELEKPETYENPARAMTINRELTSAQTTLDCLTPEWETAASKLEELQ